MTWVRSMIARGKAPVAALIVVSIVSLGARAALLDDPCRSPCRGAADHLLIFDEDYYVNAARVIAGVRPPASVPYAQAPSGDDPNAEHPQLAKLVMAGSIELFGDGPFSWRLGSLVMGSLAILGMFALVLAAGGGPWAAVGAAALMAADNLLLVHGRIATLDIYAVAAMVWGAALYLRGRPLIAGAVIGVGACFKLVAPYVLAVLVLAELFGWASTRERPGHRLLRFLECLGVATGVFIGLLAVLDAVAPPYNDAAKQLITGGALHHLSHMISYAAHQTSPHGPKGIASYPWQWLVDSGWITYLSIVPSHPSAGLTNIQPEVHFLGLINPPILLAGLIGLGLAAFSGLKRRIDRPGPRAAAGVGAWGFGRVRAEKADHRGTAAAPVSVPVLAVAWFLGTFLPFLALTLIWQRTSYLYYMVIVMPGIYVAAAFLLERVRWRWLLALWLVAIAIGAGLLYPFNPFY
ncbi:MAG: glycosyltransferase family 39 protein [Actinomycetota bacterium]|nr:glycosyltransferase family 39 protein [Actinomycetota bacterium]